MAHNCSLTNYHITYDSTFGIQFPVDDETYDIPSRPLTWMSYAFAIKKFFVGVFVLESPYRGVSVSRS